MALDFTFGKSYLVTALSIGLMALSGCDDSENNTQLITAPEKTCVASIATDDIKSTEVLATQLLNTSEVQTLKNNLKQEWFTALTQRLGTLTASEVAQLDDAVNELIFVYAQRAANGDPARPKISWTEAPPHSWGTTQVTGSRYAGDNPDNIYRIAPIDGVSTYEITGQVNAKAPTEFLIQVTNSGDFVIGTDEVSLQTLKVNADGTFKITVSPQAGDGTSNHLKTGALSTQLFIRDSMADWATETPVSLSIRRISGPNTAAKTFSEMVAETVATSTTMGKTWLNYFTLKTLFSPETNTIPQPVTGTGNISRTGGNFNLADDEALVISINPGPATYTGFTVQNIWGITPDYWNIQTGLTNKQAQPNKDGHYTYVLSKQDPGVHNWLSTAGENRGTLYLRWQGAALAKNPTIPYVTSKVIKLSELKYSLATETKYLTALERIEQLKARKVAFDRRLHACS